jgi:hypothetical protein
MFLFVWFVVNKETLNERRRIERQKKLKQVKNKIK